MTRNTTPERKPRGRTDIDSRDSGSVFMVSSLVVGCCCCFAFFGGWFMMVLCCFSACVSFGMFSIASDCFVVFCVFIVLCPVVFIAVFLSSCFAAVFLFVSSCVWPCSLVHEHFVPRVSGHVGLATWSGGVVQGGGFRKAQGTLLIYRDGFLRKPPETEQPNNPSPTYLPKKECPTPPIR